MRATHRLLGSFPTALFGLFVSLIAFVVGCGSGSKTTSAPSAAATVSITASPTSIPPGSFSTITVAAANATSVVVAGSDGSSLTLSTTGGSQNVNPSAAVTYTATATGATGNVTAQTTVAVTSTPAPTVTLTASPTSITKGASSTLTAAAINATGVTIAGSDGSSYILAAASGTQVVSPSAMTIYTVTATGTGGQATAQALVTVNAVPTLTITANPASISANSSSTLTVGVTNATILTLTGSDGTSYTLPLIGGTKAVTPTVTTTYTATATGAGGKVTKTAVVTVTPNPPPVVTVTASPSSVTASQSSLLTVVVLSATSVSISGSDGSKYALSSSGGSQAVSPPTTTTYTVTGVGAGGTTTAQTTVTVTPNPAPSVMLTASPTSILAGGFSVLTVDAINAAGLTITGSDGSTYSPASMNSSQTVTPGATTTYTATATGPGGTTTVNATVTVTPIPAPTGTISASPASISSGNSSTLTYSTTNVTAVTITGTDGSSYSSGLAPTSGTQTVTPTASVTYTLTVTGQNGKQITAATSVAVTPVGTGSVRDIDHVVFMLQENRSFDSYFGMLNPYRAKNSMNIGADGVNYAVDGIDDKLTTVANSDDEGTSFTLFKLGTTCIDDLSSAWLESYGDVSRYDFTTNRAINMDGFVHTAEGFAKSCQGSGTCSGTFTDFQGERAMGYYDDSTLNYYYNMASQFALSDRWFTPMSSKSIDNRIATFTGGTTQGLTADPGNNDGLGQLTIPTIFGELQTAGVSWKVYYSVTQGQCKSEDDCPATANARYPGTNFSSLQESYKYMYIPQGGAACAAPAISSNNPVTNDSTGSFCVDPTHIAPLSQYYKDVANGDMPAFAFIEAGYGNNDEHPGSGQSILAGQTEVASILNSFMNSPSWKDSVFFLAYDEAGGPFDHVPPVPNHSNDYTSPMVGGAAKSSIPDIGSIAVNADTYKPCQPTPAGSKPTLHCDLNANSPGANPADAAAVNGFGAQLGFRIPNMVISPFTKAHYVSHIPMDHTAILKFVENRFVPGAHLTARDAAQPDLLNFFNFQNPPWATPPTPPQPVTDPSGATCHPTTLR